MTTSTVNPNIPVAGTPISSAPIRGNFAAAASDINNIYNILTTVGTGTVTSVAGTNVNGVAFSISNPTTTPNITISLGAITPASIVASGNISGANLSGTNTGDQTNIVGNAGTATALQASRNINGVGFNGTADITVTAAANTINGLITQGTNVTITGSGTSISPYVITSSATAATAFSAITGSTNTSAAMIVGTGASFAASGSGAITATAAPAAGITGATLASNVLTSSLTTVGTLGSLSVTGNITNAGLTASQAVFTDGSKNFVSVATTGSGSVVLVTSPTLVTPTLGVASATTINKVTITAPGTGSTLTIANGKTLTVSNTIAFTATDGSTLAIGTGGTLNTAAYVATGTSGSTIPILSGTNTWSGTQSFNNNTLVLKGSISGTTVVNSASTASGTITIPAATDTLVGKATADIFTNKSYDTAGTGNVFKINGTQISSVSGNTSKVATTSGALPAGDVAVFDASGNIIDGGTPITLNSPAFTGTPTAPTASVGTSTTQLATTAFANPATTNGATGSVELPGGTIIKWGHTGVIPGNSSPVAVTFATSFPNACDWAGCSAFISGYSGALTGEMMVTAIGSSGITVYNSDGGQSQTGYWLAIGH